MTPTSFAARDLLGSADRTDAVARDSGIKAAGVAVGDDAVAHLDTGIGEYSHSARRAEVDVVGVSRHRQYAANAVGVNHPCSVRVRLAGASPWWYLSNHSRT